MSNQWSDNLRKRMEIHQEPSPEGLWEDIEQAMKQNNSVKIPPKPNKLLLWGKRIGAVAAAVLALLFIGDYLFKETPMKPIVQETQVSNKSKGVSVSPQNNQRKLITERKSNKLFFSKENDAVMAVTEISENSLHGNKDSLFIAQVEEKRDIKENSQSDSSAPKKEEKDSHNLKKDDFGRTNKYDLDTDLPMLSQRHKSAKWETGLYASNIPSGSAKMYNGYGSLVSGEIPSDMEEENPVLGGGANEDPYEEILVGNEYREVYTDVKHKLPITMGISLNYNLDDKWSLTSGVTYTILSSELRSGSDSYYYTSEQTLHNVGIPLSVNYNIWQNKKMGIYISGGGLVEKNVSGKLTTDYVVDSKLKSSQKDKISIHQLQWSVNTSVGIQYRLSPKIGLYAESGVSYHFKNGSQIETIYKDKPLNLSLRFGLRFSLSE